MNKILILNEDDIKKVINLKLAIESDESAYVQKSHGKGKVWPLVFYEYQHNIFDLDIRSGNLDETGAYGLKLISYNENNKDKGIDKVNATSLVFDSTTGVPIALLNASPITSYRTGAAAAVGAKYLARKDSKNLLVIGCGNIAIHSIAATLLEMNNIEQINIYNPRASLSIEKLNTIKDQIKAILKSDQSKMSDVSFNIVSDIENATKNADIIITATPSEKPIIMKDWIRKGTHLSCMGACIVGHQEIDENIFAIARCFADDEEQCLKCGEAQTAKKKEIISKFTDEIGNVISGTSKGRVSEDDITIFDSTGLFLQDLETSMRIIKCAEKDEIGEKLFL